MTELDFLTDLGALVEVESSTADEAGCERALVVLGTLVQRHVGRSAQIVREQGRPHLYLPAVGTARVLLLGHIDTVWPTGTLEHWPLAVQGDNVSGPGVFDMKAGLVMGLYAMAQLGGPAGVALLVTTDEEVGSVTSQDLIQRVARDADAVLVLEPAGPGGAVKKGRKGVGSFEVVITGRAAHAGLEPEKGINALVELSHLIGQVLALAKPGLGTTVTPTVATAGTTMNTVPAQARLLIDLRAENVREIQRVHTGLHALAPTLRGARIQVIDNGMRPPLEEAMSATLLDRYRAVAAPLGSTLPEAVTVGGGSDGNFTAAMGIPTLDGLGAVGDGAHAAGEHILLGPTLQATRRLTALLSNLLDSPPP
ncbi:MAG: M20/M25/M40 family metallo-hydrolase [Euzebya sp.]